MNTHDDVKSHPQNFKESDSGTKYVNISREIKKRKLVMYKYKMNVSLTDNKSIRENVQKIMV